MTEIKNSAKAGQWLDPSASDQYPADSSTDSSTADAAANSAQAQGALPNHVPIGTASTQGTQAAGSVDGLSRTGSIKGVNYVARPEITSSGPELPDVRGPSAPPQQVLRALGAYVRQPANSDQQSPSNKAATTQAAGESSSQNIGCTGNANHVSLVEVYNILGDAAQKGLDLSGKIRLAAGKNTIQSKINEVQALKEKIAGEQKSAATTFVASVGAAVLTATLAGRGTMMMGDPQKRFWDFARPGGFMRKNVKPHPSSLANKASPETTTAETTASLNKAKGLEAQQEQQAAQKASEAKSHAENTATNTPPSSSDTAAANANASRNASEHQSESLATSRNEAPAAKSRPQPASLADEHSALTKPVISKGPRQSSEMTDQDRTSAELKRSNTNQSSTDSEGTLAPSENGKANEQVNKTAPSHVSEENREGTKETVETGSSLPAGNPTSSPNNATGTVLQSGAQQFGGIVTEMTNLIDKMAGGKHEADQAEIQSKTEAVMSQIAQNAQESAKSSYDQALENIKNVFQTVSQTYQRWAQVTDNISNR